MISLFTHYSGLREYIGTEKDRPPFDVPNGSKLSLMDGKTFWFDGENNRWISSDGEVINPPKPKEDDGGTTIVTPQSVEDKK